MTSPRHSFVDRLRSWMAAVSMAVAGWALLGGCAVSGGYPDQFTEASRRNEMTLRVVNSNISDVRVYFIRGSTPVPVGTVRSMSVRSFQIAPAVLQANAELRLTVRAFGSDAPVNLVPLHVRPNDLLELRVENNLRLSQLIRRSSPGG